MVPFKLDHFTSEAVYWMSKDRKTKNIIFSETWKLNIYPIRGSKENYNHFIKMYSKTIHKALFETYYAFKMKVYQNELHE